jgi:phosphotransferase system IIB component
MYENSPYLDAMTDPNSIKNTEICTSRLGISLKEEKIIITKINWQNNHNHIYKIT